ncbi:hypothetical protein PtA15_10A406 [Puccinia triticina]|nr:uncharacterized protein PtA15_10A406 [Puccinia triticina]WAQ88983.1 hypothetical protein PtA15_10A406 [Puccinia triticina]WAR59041.1 hypothetical protein PtB15_10B383 [Puccinia triticina]
MPFTKLIIRSVTYVADRPILGKNHLYKIPSAVAWITSGGMIEPLYNIFFNIFTPAPMESGPEPASWLVFEGPMSAPSNSTTISVTTHASSFHATFPVQKQTVGYAELEGVLKVVQASDVILAEDPDTHESCMFAMSSDKTNIRQALQTIAVGKCAWIAAEIIARNKNVINIKVNNMFVIDGFKVEMI